MSDTAVAFLVLSLVGLGLSTLTLLRVRLLGAMLVPTFFVGWLRGELALQTIALEGLVVSIQTTRLVMFEFFRRFLVGGGRSFRPLRLPAPEDGAVTAGAA